MYAVYAKWWVGYKCSLYKVMGVKCTFYSEQNNTSMWKLISNDECTTNPWGPFMVANLHGYERV